MNRVLVSFPIVLLFCACAGQEGPVEPVPPCVEVHQFDSTLITPAAIDFVGKVAIENRMRGPLQIERVDYCAELHDKPLTPASFTSLHSMKAHGTQTLTLPIRIEMGQIANQVEDVLAEESVRVTLRGTVYPVGFEPIPFTATKVLPVPRPPLLSLDGAEGSPLEGAFTVFVRVQNSNAFALDFRSVETHLTLNGKRYDLLQTESCRHIEPGASGRLALTMRQTRGKGLSMLVNVARNQGADFTVGGSLQCQTPHGLFQVPVDLQSSSATPGR